MPPIGNENLERAGVEGDIPLFIWETTQFQSWYQAQKKAGHRFEKFQLLWHYLVGKNKEHVYAFAVRCELYIPSENRIKAEVVLARPDICSVVAYRKPQNLENILDTEIVLVRECRLSASMGDCFVREVPGGSSWDKDEHKDEVALHELSEETGFVVDASRLRYIGTRQLVATFSSHQAHVFACAITNVELEQLKRERGVMHGIPNSEEQTYIEVYTLRQLLLQPLTDWSNLGMIFASSMNSEQ